MYYIFHVYTHSCHISKNSYDTENIFITILERKELRMKEGLLRGHSLVSREAGSKPGCMASEIKFWNILPCGLLFILSVPSLCPVQSPAHSRGFINKYQMTSGIESKTSNIWRLKWWTHFDLYAYFSHNLIELKISQKWSQSIEEMLILLNAVTPLCMQHWTDCAFDFMNWGPLNLFKIFSILSPFPVCSNNAIFLKHN